MLGTSLEFVVVVLLFYPAGRRQVKDNFVIQIKIYTEIPANNYYKKIAYSEYIHISAVPFLIIANC